MTNLVSQKDGVGFFLTTNFDIFSSPATLNESWEWQVRDLSELIAVELGSLTKHFALMSDTDAPCALHPEWSGGTAHARILHEGVCVGRYSLSRGAADSDSRCRL